MQEAQKDKQLDHITAILCEIMQKLDMFEEEQKLSPPSKSAKILAKIKSAFCITNISSTGFEYFAGPFEENLESFCVAKHVLNICVKIFLM